MKQALLVAAVFEVSGAVIAGGAVTDTIRSGIVDLGGVSISPSDFIYIMLAALAAAAFWLLFATRMGYPVSTTHSIIGGIVGAAITLGFVTGQGSAALQMVQWDQIVQIVISWVLSPVLGGIAGLVDASGEMRPPRVVAQQGLALISGECEFVKIPRLVIVLDPLSMRR